MVDPPVEICHGSPCREARLHPFRPAATQPLCKPRPGAFPGLGNELQGAGSVTGSASPFFSRAVMPGHHIAATGAVGCALHDERQ